MVHSVSCEATQHSAVLSSEPFSHVHSVDSTSAAGQKLTAMLRNITEAYKETLTLLQLEAFPAAVALFRFKGRKAIALNITETLLDNGVMVPSVEQVGV